MLPSGKIETLITNLFDLDKSAFKALYFKRWPVEIKYDIVKKSWNCLISGVLQRILLFRIFGLVCIC